MEWWKILLIVLGSTLVISIIGYTFENKQLTSNQSNENTTSYLEEDNTSINSILEESKYSSEDMGKVRELSKKYKYNLSEFRIDYEITFPVEYVYNSEYLRDLYGNEKRELGFRVITPYHLAIKDFSEKERKYEEYADDEIIEYLNKDFIHIQIAFSEDYIYSYNLEGLGDFETFALKVEDKIYTKEEKSDLYAYGKNKILKFANYYEYHNKEIKIIYIAETGELEFEIDMTNFK